MIKLKQLLLLLMEIKVILGFFFLFTVFVYGQGLNISNSLSKGNPEISKETYSDKSKINITNDRFFACAILYFLKVEKDALELSTLERKVEPDYKKREKKVIGKILEKCNQTITLEIARKFNERKHDLLEKEYIQYVDVNFAEMDSPNFNWTLTTSEEILVKKLKEVIFISFYLA